MSSSTEQPPVYDSREMARRGRIGALRQQALHDPRETTAAGRRAFLDRFVDEVDPERILPESERARRAEAALGAYMQRLGRRSAQARRHRTGRPGSSSGS